MDAVIVTNIIFMNSDSVSWQKAFHLLHLDKGDFSLPKLKRGRR